MIQAAKTFATVLFFFFYTTGLIGAEISFGFTVIPYVIAISIIVALLMIISLIKIPTTEKPGMPGVRCPICASRGIETWVLPGKHCPNCGHACDW